MTTHTNSLCFALFLVPRIRVFILVLSQYEFRVTQGTIGSKYCIRKVDFLHDSRMYPEIFDYHDPKTNKLIQYFVIIMIGELWKRYRICERQDTQIRCDIEKFEMTKEVRGLTIEFEGWYWDIRFMHIYLRYVAW